MESLGYLYNLLDQSDVSVFGYTNKNERLKDEFISKLSHYRVTEIGSSFNITQCLRDIKLNQLLNNKDGFKWIVLDIGDMKLSYESDSISFAKEIGTIIESIRSDMYKIYNQEQENSLGLDFDDPMSHQPEKKFTTPYKLLVTTPMYKSFNGFEVNNFVGGSRSLYAADLAFVLLDSKIFKKPSIKVIKNRYGNGEESEISIDPLERDMKISKLLKN